MTTPDAEAHTERLGGGLEHTTAVPADPPPDRHVQIDREALQRAGLLAPESQEWRLAEEYRVIKRPLLAKAGGRAGTHVPRANLVGVCSALSGEGKTFTCINLSLSIAREQDWSVLLVDGDVARPYLSQLFGLDQEPGLLDVVRNPQLPLDSCIVPTDIPRLAILPAGGRDEHAEELLASDRMAQLAEQLADPTHRRLVLFDSPPLLATTEASVLASHMGQIALVVKAGSTSHQQVQQALARLDAETKAIGLVLNQAEFGSGLLGDGVQYGYGYAHAQRYGHDHGQRYGGEPRAGGDAP